MNAVLRLTGSRVALPQTAPPELCGRVWVRATVEEHREALDVREDRGSNTRTTVIICPNGESYNSFVSRQSCTENIIHAVNSIILAEALHP